MNVDFMGPLPSFLGFKAADVLLMAATTEIAEALTGIWVTLFGTSSDFGLVLTVYL